MDTVDEDKENNVCDDDDDDDASIRFGTDPVPYAWKNVTKNGWIKKCVLVGKPICLMKPGLILYSAICKSEEHSIQLK